MSDGPRENRVPRSTTRTRTQSIGWVWKTVLRRSLRAATLLLTLPALTWAVDQRDIPKLSNEVLDLLARGRYEAALEPAQELVQLLEKYAGEDDPNTASALHNLGMVYAYLEEYDKAEELYKRALRIQEERLAPDDGALAFTLTNLANLYKERAEYARAGELYERALPIAERAWNENPREFAHLLMELGSLERAKSEFDAAAEHFERALDLLEESGETRSREGGMLLTGLAALYQDQARYDEAARLYARGVPILEASMGAHPAVAPVLHNQAELFRLRSDYVRAEELHRRALAIEEQTLREDHPQVLQGLQYLAFLRVELGQHERARRDLERLLRLQEKKLGTGHTALVRTLTALGRIAQRDADFAAAERYRERALEVAERGHGADNPEFATMLNEIATVAHERGDLDAALRLYERALQIQTAALGPAHPGTNVVRGNLALLYHVRGDPQRAALLGEEAWTHLEAVQGEARPETVAALHNLGMFYLARADRERAEALLERAAAAEEQIYGSNHPEYAKTLTQIGLLERSGGDLNAAITTFERALAIRKATLGSEHPHTAIAMQNLGDTYLLRGRIQNAKPLLEMAHTTLAGSLGEAHYQTAASLNSLGFLHHRAGDAKRAANYYGRAIAAIEANLGPQHPLVGQSAQNLALLLWEGGDFQGARRLLDRTAQIEERQIRLVLPLGSETQALNFMQSLRLSSSLVLSLQRAMEQDPEATRLALEMTLRRKGRVLETVAEGQGWLRDGMGKEERKLLEELARTRRSLANLAVAAMRAGPNAKLTESRQKLGRELEALEARAQRMSLALRAAALPVTVPGVQTQLPERAALVEFVRYPRLNASASRWDNHRYTAFVLTPGDAPVAFDLGEAESLEAVVSEFRDVLRQPTVPPGRIREVAQRLYAELIAPLETALGGSSLVLVAPDGPLNLVPFGALVDADGRYLIERVTLGYLTSGRDLLTIGVPRNPRGDPVVIGGPDFGERSAESVGSTVPQGQRRSADFGTRYFSKLPGTAREAKEISSLLGVDPLIGARATEGNIKGVERPRLLHIATHGFFLSDQPLEPLPTRGLRIFAVEDYELGGVENPLLRSGLALAGVNALGEGSDDGILTGLELTGLDLSGTQLVVLSACETGSGDVTVGEGVYGLRRSLVLAGATAQVTSLWKVDDAATRQFMLAYYRRITAGEGRAEALRQVQLEIRKNAFRGRPYYWASFLPVGDWGPIPTTSP